MHVEARVEPQVLSVSGSLANPYKELTDQASHKPSCLYLSSSGITSSTLFFFFFKLCSGVQAQVLAVLAELPPTPLSSSLITGIWSQTWPCMSVILALERLGQGDFTFQVILGYIVDSVMNACKSE